MKSITRTIFLLIVVSFILVSCEGIALVFEDSNEYIEERKLILKERPFDESIISNILHYDTIESLLIDNMGALFAQEEEECWIVYRKDNFMINGKNMSQLPMAIEKVEKVFRKLGEDRILAANLKRDSSIRFVIRNWYISKYNSDVRESLKRINQKIRPKTPQNDPFMKDTIINRKWEYTIWVDKRAGW